MVESFSDVMEEEDRHEELNAMTPRVLEPNNETELGDCSTTSYHHDHHQEPQPKLYSSSMAVLVSPSFSATRLSSSSVDSLVCLTNSNDLTKLLKQLYTADAQKNIQIDFDWNFFATDAIHKEVCQRQFTGKGSSIPCRWLNALSRYIRKSNALCGIKVSSNYRRSLADHIDKDNHQDVVTKMMQLIPEILMKSIERRQHSRGLLLDLSSFDLQSPKTCASLFRNVIGNKLTTLCISNTTIPYGKTFYTTLFRKFGGTIEKTAQQCTTIGSCLHRLELSNCQLDDSFLVDLSQVLIYTATTTQQSKITSPTVLLQLREIDLSYNQFTTTGMKTLANALRKMQGVNTYVKWEKLNLSNNHKITSKGVLDMLDAVPFLPSTLMELDLSSPEHLLPTSVYEKCVSVLEQNINIQYLGVGCYNTDALSSSSCNRYTSDISKSVNSENDSNSSNNNDDDNLVDDLRFIWEDSAHTNAIDQIHFLLRMNRYQLVPKNELSSWSGRCCMKAAILGNVDDECRSDDEPSNGNIVSVNNCFKGQIDESLPETLSKISHSEGLNGIYYAIHILQPYIIGIR